MIIISPFAKQMREPKPHPKNYPFWPELVNKLKLEGYNIVQVGLDGEQQLVDDFRKNLSLTELKTLVLECKTWISVDSFFQHFCWDLQKYGIVLFGQSDPNIFGHPENINLLKDRKYLRKQQFWWWEQTDLIPDSFVKPKEVIEALKKIQ